MIDAAINRTLRPESSLDKAKANVVESIADPSYNDPMGRRMRDDHWNKYFGSGSVADTMARQNEVNAAGADAFMKRISGQNDARAEYEKSMLARYRSAVETRKSQMTASREVDPVTGRYKAVDSGIGMVTNVAPLSKDYAGAGGYYRDSLLNRGGTEYVKDPSKLSDADVGQMWNRKTTAGGMRAPGQTVIADETGPVLKEVASLS